LWNSGNTIAGEYISWWRQNILREVTSGDAETFYRAFGEKGETPIVIMHGTTYYDSRDWIEVAAKLAEISKMDKGTEDAR